MEWFPKLRIGDLPDRAAARWPDRIALVEGDRRWTHAEFATEVRRAAKGLIALGVEPGDKVAIWMTNRSEWLFLMYAIPMVGAVTVPLNTRYRTDDVVYTVDQSDSSVLFVNDRSGPIDYASMVREALPRWPKIREVVVVGDDLPDGSRAWAAFLDAGRAVTDDALVARAAAVDPDALALIIYTSGTTSLPKGAMHNHVLIRNIVERAQILGVTCTDAFVSYLPLFHAFGYTEVALTVALTGAKQVLVETFDADAVLDLAEAEQVTILHGFDAHWQDFLRARDTRPRDLALRFGMLAAGQESSRPVAYRSQELCPTVTGWGMSEVWTAITISHISSTPEQRCEASGYPMFGVELRIVDPETGADQPAGEPGELLVRSYTRMLGYYEKPTETAETIDAEGWLHTGDLARIRTDGHMQFIGRLKDMLKIGGENVAPAEIEGRLRELPGVVDAAVVGIPDDRLGEIGVAYVLRAPDATLDPSGLLDHLRGRIASFKIPRHVFVVDALPMTPTGKIRKVELREQARSDVASA